jgi:hypothetical protein
MSLSQESDGSLKIDSLNLAKCARVVDFPLNAHPGLETLPSLIALSLLVYGTEYE